MLVFTFFILFLQQFEGTPHQICTKLHMGSGIQGSNSNDIIRAGFTQGLWDINNAGTPIISATKSIEFFYISNIDYKLTQSDIQLFYDNQHVTSQMILKEEEKGSYTIEVSYHCNSYGGNLIHFRLQIFVPECGVAFVGWRKLCGNPYTEREGFSIDMISDNSIQTIVKNGRTINSMYFEKEINNNAYLIPGHINMISLELYMNPNDIIDNRDPTIVHAFRGIIQNMEKKNDLSTEILRVRVDSDKNLVQTEINGELNNSSVELTHDMNTTIDLIFHCESRGGKSPVELDIILPAFKDISVIFIKNCQNISEGNNLFQYFLILLIIATLFKLSYSFLKQQGDKNKKEILTILSDTMKEILLKLDKIFVSKFPQYFAPRVKELNQIERKQNILHNGQIEGLGLGLGYRKSEMNMYGTL